MKALFPAALVALGLTALAVCWPCAASAAAGSGPGMQLAQYPPPGYRPPPPSYPPPCNYAGGAFRGAARGAAGGAIFGAIGGNAGAGAAVGAAIGGLAGASRRAAAQSYGYCY